jgi:uncharacterized membrane protein YedE/YeeE
LLKAAVFQEGARAVSAFPAALGMVVGPAAMEIGPLRPVGGLGLGVGASLAAGCTVGHGLAGLPLLAPGSVVAIVSIYVGANLLPLGQRAFARADAATAGSA